jgi:hypothetical protein
MADRIWETSKLCYCERVMSQVGLEVEMLYPIDFLPDPPRVRSHRCSHGLDWSRARSRDQSFNPVARGR